VIQRRSPHLPSNPHCALAREPAVALSVLRWVPWLKPRMERRTKECGLVRATCVAPLTLLPTDACVHLLQESAARAQRVLLPARALVAVSERHASQDVR
jgi:hypothetical protein